MIRQPRFVPLSRAVPGSWEGDLVIGKAGKSAMATLVERTSRYTVPVALPAGKRDATTTANALIGAVSGMPAALVKTLTWDQGSQMAAHAAFTPCHQDRRLLRPPTLPLGTRHQREHCECPTGCCASTSPRALRSPTTRATSTGRARAEQPATAYPRLPNPSRSLHRLPGQHDCYQRLRPPAAAHRAYHQSMPEESGPRHPTGPPTGAVVPAGDLRPVVSPSQTPPARSSQDVLLHSPDEIGFLPDHPLRDTHWLNLPEKVRTRLLDRAGDLVEWWADDHPGASDQGTTAVVMGTTALCTADARFDPRRNRFALWDLKYYVFQPDSRHRKTVSSEPATPRRGAATGRPPGSALMITHDHPAPTLPGLGAAACGLLGNLPPRAQQLLQSPFVRAKEAIDRCDSYYTGFPDTGEIDMFAVYLRSATALTFAKGTRTTGGAWSLECHTAELRPRSPSHTASLPPRATNP